MCPMTPPLDDALTQEVRVHARRAVGERVPYRAPRRDGGNRRLPALAGGILAANIPPWHGRDVLREQLRLLQPSVRARL